MGGTRRAPVFLIGAPRSGTTWLQCLLGAHPSIATPQEPEFFSGYVRAWHRIWSYELRTIEDESSNSRLKGVASVMTDAEFTAMVRAAIDRFHDAALALKPGATVVLEKCPGAHHPVDLMQHYVPEARFIHLVRDGRDVTGSLRAASSGWARQWAPADVAGGAELWAASIRNAYQARHEGRYLELRYEDMRAEGAALLEKTLAFCDVETTLAQAEAIVERFSFDALKNDPSRPYTSVVVGGELVARLGEHLRFPEGFFREGRSGGWQETWSAYDRAEFDRVAGDLLVDLEYEPDHSWAEVPGSERTRARVAQARASVYDGVTRVRQAARAAVRELKRSR